MAERLRRLRDHVRPAAAPSAQQQPTPAPAPAATAFGTTTHRLTDQQMDFFNTFGYVSTATVSQHATV